ncbi:MAG: hypothetical protein KBD26_01430 [Candidatus Pacebacteria bacterium]|nr:hypothetical protein [Candidatus Paceibacterota bacterium]
MNLFLFDHEEKVSYLFSGNNDFLVNLVLACITLLAVLVALFQEKIKNYFSRAKVKFEINLIPPDCHQITLSDLNSGKHISNCIYIRICVIHLKGATAKNVEVIISNFWEIDNYGTRKISKKFIPMNLIWSHFRTQLIQIPNGIFRYCDLGYIAPMAAKNTYLKLDTITQPGMVSGGEFPNIFKAGKYEFELVLTGDNVQPKTQCWSLDFDGVWVENENEMLAKHIIIKEI